jgi:hypothetical protein
MDARFNAQALLDLWERAANAHPVDRALCVLSALLCLPRQELASLDIGRRDALLLKCRAELFGETIAGFTRCPSCSCSVQVAVEPQDDLPELPPAAETSGWFAVPGFGGVECRLPTSYDLAAIALCEGVEAARDALRSRCVRSSTALDETDHAGVETEIAKRSGVAALTPDVDCPSCGHKWSLDLDIGAFLWDELKAKAARLLRDVDVLARRYGWSERDILALSDARRNHYLELAE